MNLYLFKGLPGVGKSTVARNFASDIGALCINKDDINNIVFKHFGANKNSSETVYEVIHYILILLKESIENLVVDCSLGTGSSYISIQKLCVENEINLQVIEVYLDDYTIVSERLKSRTDFPEHRIKSIEDIKKQALVYEDYSIENLIRVENSGDLSDTVKALRARLSL